MRAPRPSTKCAMEHGHPSAECARLLNALVGLELLVKNPDGGYALSAESATFLVRGKPRFHGAFFLLTSGRMLLGWRNLQEIVRTGRPAQQINLEHDGVPFFLQFVA